MGLNGLRLKRLSLICLRIDLIGGEKTQAAVFVAGHLDDVRESSSLGAAFEFITWCFPNNFLTVYLVSCARSTWKLIILMSFIYFSFSLFLPIQLICFEAFLRYRQTTK